MATAVESNPTEAAPAAGADEASTRKQLESMLEEFAISSSNLMKVKESFIAEVSEESSIDPSASKGIRYLVTFLQDLPCGCEHGMFVAVVWRVRVTQLLLVHLRGANKPIVDESEFRLPEKPMDATEVCDLIAEKLAAFLKNISLDREQLPLILITPNPIHNKGLRNGNMLSMKKGVPLRNFRKRDMNQLLKESINRLPQKLHVDIVAMANEVTAAFLNCVSQHQDCRITLLTDSMMLAYWDTIDRVPQPELIDPEKSNVLINLTLGNFGDQGQLSQFITDYDVELDPSLLKTPIATFERLCSHEGITELVRLMMLKAIDAGLLFEGTRSAALAQYGSIRMPSLDQVLREGKGPYYDTVVFLERLGVNAPSKEDCERVYNIIKAIVQRSVDLLATVLSAIIEKLHDTPSIVISIDGQLNIISQYNTFLTNRIIELLDQPHEFQVINIMDKEGRGAALLGSISLRDDYIYRVHDPMYVVSLQS